MAYAPISGLTESHDKAMMNCQKVYYSNPIAGTADKIRSSATPGENRLTMKYSIIAVEWLGVKGGNILLEYAIQQRHSAMYSIVLLVLHLIHDKEFRSRLVVHSLRIIF